MSLVSLLYSDRLVVGHRHAAIMTRRVSGALATNERTCPCGGASSTAVRDGVGPRPPSSRRVQRDAGRAATSPAALRAGGAPSRPGELRVYPKIAPAVRTAHLICNDFLSSGQGEAPPERLPGGASVVARRLGSGRACRWRRAVRLICAGWVPQDGLFGWSGSACLGSSVAHRSRILLLLIGVSRVTPRAATRPHRRVSLWEGLFVHHGQRPAPPGEFAGDSDIGDDGFLLTLNESDPSIVQAMIPSVAASPGGR